MSSAGTLTIDLVASVARLEADMKNAANTVKTQTQIMEGAVDGLKTALGALGVGFGVLGAAQWIKSQVELGDQLSKTSEKIGVSVEKLSAYQYAAKLSGVSNEDLEKSLAKLGKSVAEGLVDPVGKAGEALRNLGLTSNDLKNKKLSDIFEEIAPKLANISNESVRMQYEMTLLGKSGYQLQPLLKNLGELTEEAKKNGHVISTEWAKASEELSDEFDRMKMSAQQFLATSENGSSILEAFMTVLKSIQWVALGIAQGFEELGRSLGALAAAGVAAAKLEFSEAKNIMKELDADLTAIQQRGEAARAALFDETKKTGAKGAGAAGSTDVQALGIQSDSKEGTMGDMKRTIQALTEEREAYLNHYYEMQDDLANALATELITREQFAEMTANLEQQKQEKLFQIQQKENARRYGNQFLWMGQINQLMQGGYNQQIQGMGMIFGQMSNLMQSHKKKEFEIGKKAALAQAAISMYQGVGMALSYGFPMGLIFGALVLAQGLMNIQRINSQQFGAAAATPTFSASPNTGIPDVGGPSIPESSAPQLPQSSQTNATPRVTNIHVASDSGMMTMDYFVKNLLPVINEAAGDGNTIKVMAA